MLSALITTTIDFVREDYFYRASALAFTTLLALVPFLVVVLFFVTWFPIFHDLISLTEKFLIDNFLPTSIMTVKKYFTEFVGQATRMPVWSVSFLLVTAMLMIRMVETIINLIWKNKRKRKTVSAIILYSLIILLTPLIMGFSIFVSTSLLQEVWVLKVTQLLGLTLILDFLFPISIDTILFTLLYVVVPNVSVKWRYALLSALITACFLNVFRLMFAIIIARFPSYYFIYGVFDVIPIFMLWLYFSWCVILWGASLTYHLQKMSNK